MTILNVKCAALQRAAVAAICLLLPIGNALADWTIDNEASKLSFVSIKKAEVAEVGTFDRLEGSLTADGSATLTIDLSSVDTLIEIRDERMREMLFETQQFPTATATMQVDAAAIEQLTSGDSLEQTVTLTLDLHGQTRMFDVTLNVTGLENNGLRVVTAKPVIVNAPDFALVEGVNKLREVAGLSSISIAVPVMANLVLTKNGR